MDELSGTREVERLTTPVATESRLLPRVLRGFTCRLSRRTCGWRWSRLRVCQPVDMVGSGSSVDGRDASWPHPTQLRGPNSLTSPGSDDTVTRNGVPGRRGSSAIVKLPWALTEPVLEHSDLQPLQLHPPPSPWQPVLHSSPGEISERLWEKPGVRGAEPQMGQHWGIIEKPLFPGVLLELGAGPPARLSCGYRSGHSQHHGPSGCSRPGREGDCAGHRTELAATWAGGQEGRDRPSRSHAPSLPWSHVRTGRQWSPRCDAGW